MRKVLVKFKFTDKAEYLIENPESVMDAIRQAKLKLKKLYPMCVVDKVDANEV